jgi:cold shock CspA family protein
MFFKYEFTVSNLGLTPTSEHYAREYPLVFDYGDVRVEIRPPTEEEEATGYQSWTSLGEAVGEFEPPKRVGPMFESLSRDELPEGSTPDEYRSYFDRERGNLRENHIPPAEIMPPAFQDFSSRVNSELRDYADRTVRVLRWHHDVEGPHNPFSYRGFKWSSNSTEWHPMPSTLTGKAGTTGSLRLTDAESQAVVQTVADSGDEPLSHQLFREAWLQRSTNRRSALVIGVSAVEVATKECIAALDPHAEWLVRELPTPPVEKMLREYVPTLPAKNTLDGDVRFPSEPLEELKKAVGWRNEVAHGGTLPVRWDRLEAFLEFTARDLIWLLTYYSGANWAFDHVSQRAKAALGIPQTWHDLGKVKTWNDEEGWGAVTSSDIPGDIWVDASMIDAEGRRTLTPGESVVIEAEGPLDRDQDGYRYRGIRATPYSF